MKSLPEPVGDVGMEVDGHVPAEDQVPGAGFGGGKDITGAPLEGGAKAGADLPAGGSWLEILVEEARGDITEGLGIINAVAGAGEGVLAAIGSQERGAMEGTAIGHEHCDGVEFSAIGAAGTPDSGALPAGENVGEDFFVDGVKYGWIAEEAGYTDDHGGHRQGEAFGIALNGEAGFLE